MGLRMKESELRAVCAKLRTYLSQNMTDVEVCEKLKISWGDYEELKSKMIAFEAEHVRNRSPEQVYVEYLMAQEKNIKSLSDMIEHYKDIKQHTAVVGAVKARAEILDKMIAKGQEFGFIDKKPERTEVVAGIFVKDLSNDDIRSHITAALNGLGQLVSAYGESNIIDIEPGPTHFPDPQEKRALASGDKPKGRARNLVHKGRRVVKEKIEV